MLQGPGTDYNHLWWGSAHRQGLTPRQGGGQMTSSVSHTQSVVTEPSTRPAGRLLSRIRSRSQELQTDGRRQVDRLKITEKAQNNKHKDRRAFAHKMMDAGILLSDLKPVFSHDYNSVQPGCLFTGQTVLRCLHIEGQDVSQQNVS